MLISHCKTDQAISVDQIKRVVRGGGGRGGLPNPISQEIVFCTKSHFPASKKGKTQLPFYPFMTFNQWRRHNLFIPSKPLFSSVLTTAFKIKHTHTKTYRNKDAGNMYTSSTSLQSIKHGKSPTSWLDRCCFSELKDEVITASQTFSLVRHSKGVS